MKKKNLIVVVASCLMLLAYFAMPYIASFKVSSFGISHAEKLNLSLFDDLKDADSVFDFLFTLLLLLSPLYLLMDVFREKLKENVPIVEKIVIPEKVALTLPLELIVITGLFINSIKPALNELVQGLAKFSVEYGSGFYLYLVAAIVVAALPWVKHPLLEEEKKEEEDKS